MGVDGEGRDGGHGEVTADELRSRARSAFAAQVTGGPGELRRGQTLISTVPVNPGVELAVIWSPSDSAARSILFLRVYATGPEGERVSASSTLRIGAGALPALAGAIADALDLAAQQFRTERHPSRSQAPASRAGGTPSTAAPSVTRGEQNRDQQDGHRDDHDRHHDGAA